MEPLKICFVMNSVLRTSQINNINWHEAAHSALLSKRSCVFAEVGRTIAVALSLHIIYNNLFWLTFPISIGGQCIEAGWDQKIAVVWPSGRRWAVRNDSGGEQCVIKYGNIV